MVAVDEKRSLRPSFFPTLLAEVGSRELHGYDSLSSSFSRLWGCADLHRVSLYDCWKGDRPATARGSGRKRCADRGAWRGREQGGQFFETLSDGQEARRWELREFVAQDDGMVTLGHYAWHVKVTGKVGESDFAHVVSARW